MTTYDTKSFFTDPTYNHYDCRHSANDIFSLTQKFVRRP